jgi:hypothetical protein
MFWWGKTTTMVHTGLSGGTEIWQPAKAQIYNPNFISLIRFHPPTSAVAHSKLISPQAILS